MIRKENIDKNIPLKVASFIQKIIKFQQKINKTQK